MNRTSTVLFFLCVFAGVSLALAQKSPFNKEKSELLKEFSNWKQQQLKNRAFWAEDSCTMQWFANHEVEDGGFARGLPDNADFNFSYGDLNNDGKQDQLVMFSPVQCDGGNGLMWTQVCVLSLSQEKGYETISDFDHFLFADLQVEEEGFYWFTKIADNKVEGLHIIYEETDAHCCPSTQIPVTFNYTTGEVLETGKNQGTAARQGFVLGNVIGDSATVKKIAGGASKAVPILDSPNKIEIRLMAGNSMSGYHSTRILSYDDHWSVHCYFGSALKSDNQLHEVVVNSDLDSVFNELVANHVFSLPDQSALQINRVILHPDSGELAERGMDIADGTRYWIEFKAGTYFRRYSYSDPHSFAGFYRDIDEYRYFARIVDLFTELIPYE